MGSNTWLTERHVVKLMLGFIFPLCLVFKWKLPGHLDDKTCAPGLFYRYYYDIIHFDRVNGPTRKGFSFSPPEASTLGQGI